MVRFMPPPLARLVTLALQTRVHQDGLAPAAVGVSTPVAVMPSDLVGLPTAYRMTQRAAALDPYEPGEQSPLRRALSEFRKAVRPNRRPKGKAYVLFEFDFRARNLALTTPEARDWGLGRTARQRGRALRRRARARTARGARARGLVHARMRAPRAALVARVRAARARRRAAGARARTAQQPACARTGGQRARAREHNALGASSGGGGRARARARAHARARGRARSACARASRACARGRAGGPRARSPARAL